MDNSSFQLGQLMRWKYYKQSQEIEEQKSVEGSKFIWDTIETVVSVDRQVRCPTCLGKQTMRCRRMAQGQERDWDKVVERYKPTQREDKNLTWINM